MKKNILLKTFENFQEKQLFLYGTIILLIGSTIGYFGSIRFDGVLDLHYSLSVKWFQPLIDNIVNTICLSACLYFLALKVNTKTRVIDIINISLISRIPFYIASLFSLGKINRDTNEFLAKNILDPIKVLDLPGLNLILLMLFTIATLIAIIFMAILIYQGYKTATNVKSTLNKILLIVVVIIAEAISKILTYQY